ncbi:dihydroorotase [Cetobacterium ceti]|uniref:Dihydroorotase n=1 Tax=Cetobacterium ceti TaxID=180163 RepID=A0A1T4KI36_9FUSO|nr:dihydroorotase family protein [Cetobacterium ceti]SJZ42007.1 dihydroorotase [Cetobacterium ceti]
MLIKNCRLVLEDNSEVIRDILIKDEKIVEIGENLQEIGEEIIDAEKNYVIPGVVDVHTHMRDPGLSHKEDFTSGSMACAKGGVTTFIDMPNTIPNTISEEVLEEKRKHSLSMSYVDYGFHFGGSRNDNSKEIEKVKNGVASTKIFLNMSTGDMLVEEEKTLENLFKSSKIISVHSEGEMVKRAIDLSRKYKKPLYLCHLSLGSEVELLKNAKEEGLEVYGEVAPHHLFFSEKDRNELLRMKPELKSEMDNSELWKGLNEGVIDTVGTDHAPHRLREKMEKVTFGIPGVENSLEMMLRGVAEKKITMRRLIEVMCINPSKIFKIKNKGDIKIGNDGDLVIIDIGKKRIIERDQVISKCGWSPYEGKETGGTVLRTILRGRTVYNQEEFFKKTGREVEYNG